MAFAIDKAHSQIEFSVKHMMITTVRGRFTSFDGTLELDAENPANSYVEGTVDVASIDTNEPNRDNHLRSADFFDAENHPQMHFESAEIERVGKDQFKVHGDLTIRETTRPIVFDVRYLGRVRDPWGKDRIGYTATTTLNRKAFGLNWNVALEAGGWLVGDEIKIAIEIQAIQEQPELEAVAAD